MRTVPRQLWVCGCVGRGKWEGRKKEQDERPSVAKSALHFRNTGHVYSIPSCSCTYMSPISAGSMLMFSLVASKRERRSSSDEVSLNWPFLNLHSGVLKAEVTTTVRGVGRVESGVVLLAVSCLLQDNIDGVLCV